MLMTDKTKEELQTELDLNKAICDAREWSEQRFAIKLVERIVFAACALVLVAVVTALIAMVVTK